MRVITGCAALAVALALAGCANEPIAGSTAASAAEGSSSYSSTSTVPLLKYGYHSGPYDNTGNGPGETGMEGGGG